MKYILSIFFLLTLSTCKRGNGNDILANPPKDYFKCKVNGQSYIAGCDDWFNHCVSSRLEHTGTSLIIIGNNNNGSIILILQDSTGIKDGVHHLINPFGLGNNAIYENYSTYGGGDFFTTDSVNTGTINVTLSKGVKRITGTFTFKAKFETSDDIVEVTDGEFSLPLDIFD